MKINAVILSILVLSGPFLFADSPVTTSAVATDPLAEALPILQAKYANFPALQYKIGDHLSDLITRSDGKISLASPVAATPGPVQSILLPEGVLYVRLASFPPTDTQSHMNWIGQIRQPGVNAYVIDLRSNTTPDDYAGASSVKGVLGPSYGYTATSTIPDDAQPITQILPGPKVVLVNKQTTGAAEALAGYLQADGAIVIGRATAGKVAVFQEAKLSTGQILRYAVAATGFDDPAVAFKFRSEVPTWGHPVTPDISVAVDEHVEKAALMLIARNRIDEVIQESAERHRMSEATLVQGQDPEWDEYLASLEKKPFLLSLPAIHDVALVRALDSLKAILVSQRKSLPPSPVATASEATTSVQ